jgi:hypothetical protein
MRVISLVLPKREGSFYYMCQKKMGHFIAQAQAQVRRVISLTGLKGDGSMEKGHSISRV